MRVPAWSPAVLAQFFVLHYAVPCHQRKALPVGRWEPVVEVVQLEDAFAALGGQFQRAAAVAQLALILADHWYFDLAVCCDAAVTHGKRLSVADDHEALARLENLGCAVEKGKSHLTTDGQAGKIERFIAVVKQL